MTKVWGFDEPAGPLQFASEGWRDNALRQLTDGDRIVLVGTLGGETKIGEQGRLLGIMEPTRVPVRSLDFDLRRSASDLDADGEYKWPVGLHNRRAWMLLDRPRLGDISDRRFSMDSAQGIVPLTSSETEAVERLARREVALLAPRAHARARIERDQERAPKHGPPPATTIRRGVMHMRRAPASTYAMELVNARSPAIKVGWAFDPTVRRDQFNHAAMPELGGLHYRLAVHQLWDTARLAYGFEQRVLRHFDRLISTRNGEIIVGVRMAEFEMAWARMTNDAVRSR